MADSRFISNLQRWADGICAGGLARTAEVVQSEYDARVRVRFEFEQGAQFTAEFTDHELRMGGERELHQWMRTIERHLARRYERYQFDGLWRRRREAALRATVDPPLLIDSNPLAAGRSWQAQFPYGVGVVDARGWLTFEFSTGRNDPAADQRAKDLFRAVAGQHAFDTLSANRPLPIIGSNGTRYTLHRRSSFCVEREEDGAKLCVVVPGVPLWDHLLGVKLMVEHDEPKFLATANVVPGYGRSPADAAFVQAYRDEYLRIARGLVQRDAQTETASEMRTRHEAARQRCDAELNRAGEAFFNGWNALGIGPLY